MEEKKNLLTYAGLKKLEEELHDLKVVKRKEVAEKIKEAREQGDLSENAEYDAAKDEQRDIEARIEEIEKILKNAEVVVEDEVDLDKISVGCKVKVHDFEFEEDIELKIVGSTEANSLEGKISNESPVTEGEWDDPAVLQMALPGTKFCTPDYSIVLSADKDETDKTTNPEGGSYMFNPETVKAGDKNTSVLLLQEILRARGFKGKNGKALKLTWTADANTIYALKAYQESRKEVLEVDGICGSATWKDLIAI